MLFNNLHDTQLGQSWMAFWRLLFLNPWWLIVNGSLSMIVLTEGLLKRRKTHVNWTIVPKHFNLFLTGIRRCKSWNCVSWYFFHGRDISKDLVMLRLWSQCDSAEISRTTPKNTLMILFFFGRKLLDRSILVWSTFSFLNQTFHSP